MKKLFLLAAVLFLATASFAQSEKYVASMKANIAAIDTSFKNPQNLLDLANKFERIAIAEISGWLIITLHFARLTIPTWKKIKPR